MKKFVIQCRKFESKKSYINKDMNFLILWNFLDFILIFKAFSRFSGFNSFKKGRKLWGDHGIVAHLNHAISAIESSFSESDGPRFSR